MTLLGGVTAVVNARWTLLLAASSLTLLYLLVGRPQYPQQPEAIRRLAVSLCSASSGPSWRPSTGSASSRSPGSTSSPGS